MRVIEVVCRLDGSDGMALLLLCCVAIVTFLPASLPEEQSVDSWLMQDAAGQASAPRRITPKSIFIAPSFSHAALPSCAEGYRPDAMGRCVKVVRVNQAAQLDFLLRRLNTLYAPPAFPPHTDTSGPLQVSLPIEEVTAKPSADAHPSSSSSVEVAVVLADVVKENETGADLPQTMLAVWNISKNTTSNSNTSPPAAAENIDVDSVRDTNSPRRNSTEFLSSLSLPKVEETIPIVMQTPPSTLVIQDLPGSDTVSRPLSTEVDFDIPYYDYYQDQDTTERRCLDPPCTDSFAEINSRSPHVPDTLFLTPSELQSDNVTGDSVTESTTFSFTTDISDSDAYTSASSNTETTLQSNVSDLVVEQHGSEVIPKEPVVLPVVNDTEAEIVGSVINTTVLLSKPNISHGVLPEIYVGSFETSAEVSVKHTPEQTHQAEEITVNNTDSVSRNESSDVPTFNTLPEINVTNSVILSRESENVPKKPLTLPEESSLLGTSMDPLSDVNVAGNEESLLMSMGALEMTEQRSPAPEYDGMTSTPPVRFPSGAEDTVVSAKSGRLRFPDTAAAESSRVVFPEDRGSFWWLPAGWKLDQSRHHPVLLRFWKKMPESYLPDLSPPPHTGRIHHGSQFYQTYADG